MRRLRRSREGFEGFVFMDINAHIEFLCHSVSRDLGSTAFGLADYPPPIFPPIFLDPLINPS